MAPSLQQRGPFKLQHLFVSLIEAIVEKTDDPRVFLRAFACLKHFTICIERIAMLDGLRQTYLVESKLGQCVLATILSTQPENERKVHAAKGRISPKR